VHLKKIIYKIGGRYLHIAEIKKPHFYEIREKIIKIQTIQKNSEIKLGQRSLKSIPYR